jgi:superfamily II DNA/RNA helicase
MWLTVLRWILTLLRIPSVSKKGDKLRALMLIPTMELTMQVHNLMVVAARHTGGVRVVGSASAWRSRSDSLAETSCGCGHPRQVTGPGAGGQHPPYGT